ncbi:MAG TPA: glycosyltransferase family 2 protein [Woeseiaceae bacterium]|nr:glycosyltransferase family 2 protein [Woeseiaceae bacterium]
MSLSVVVPLYNEEASVQRLHLSIVKALDAGGFDYEMIFVDDGSRDSTLANAQAIAASDPRLKVVEFRKNYGQTPAMAAGIDLAGGDIIVTMDGDLQNDPQDIPRFIEKMDEGYDIVVGWRFNRQDRVLTRKIPSKIANWLIGKVTGVPIKDNGCSLKAYRASVIKRVPLYNEMHRFIPAMTTITGARIAEIKVRHHARRFGESKYGLSRTWKVLLDLLSVRTITGFAQRPLTWFGWLSLPFFLLAVLAVFAALVPMLHADGTFSVTLAGTGVLLGALGIFLILGGAVGELVFSTHKFDRDTRMAPMVAHKVVELPDARLPDRN